MRCYLRFLGILTILHLQAAEVTFQIASEGVASASIVHAEDASPRVRQAAATLADYLQRISGATFPVGTERTAKAIILGTSSADIQSPFDEGILHLEEYLLRSTANHLYLLGASDIAVEYAVWDLLYRLGHRHYFPPALWEIVPNQPSLQIAVDVHERPDYLVRELTIGYGQWTLENRQALDHWRVVNRVSNGKDGFALHTSHAWAGILDSYKAVFEANPEFLPLLNGQRRAYEVSIKFCTSNPGLRDFITNLALRAFERSPERHSISLDPSDLGNWCQCENCIAIGPITDRAMLLINQAAKAIHEAHGDKYVGMQAFAYHAKPPTGPVEPNVVVTIATSLNQTGMTIPELMAGWQDRGALIGMREYYGVTKWHHDLPKRSRAANPRHLARSLVNYHGLGARFLVSECLDNWAAYGLGHYLAGRVSWDITEADQSDAIIEEFITLCYGPAADPMRHVYELLDGRTKDPLTADYLYRLSVHLDQALRSAAHHPLITQRIEHMILYVHYVHLYLTYRHADTRSFTKEITVDARPIRDIGPGTLNGAQLDDGLLDIVDDILETPDSERQATITINTNAKREALEAMLRHVWRIRTTMMMHSKGIYRVHSESGNVPPGVGWMSSPKDDPWKDEVVYTRFDIDSFLTTLLSLKPNQENTP